jgi:hypothetical protein
VLLGGQYRREFSVRVAPSRDTTYRTVKQFEGTGIARNILTKGRKGSSPVCAEEAIGTEESQQEYGQEKCEGFGTTDWGLNQHGVEICHGVLPLFRYKI